MQVATELHFIIILLFSWRGFLNLNDIRTALQVHWNASQNETQTLPMGTLLIYFRLEFCRLTSKSSTGFLKNQQVGKCTNNLALLNFFSLYLHFYTCFYWPSSSSITYAYLSWKEIAFRIIHTLFPLLLLYIVPEVT